MKSFSSLFRVFDSGWAYRDFVIIDMVDCDVFVVFFNLSSKDCLVLEV